MSKKLKGELFLYSGNRLVDGKVVYFLRKGCWVENSIKAKKIKLEEIIKLEKAVKSDEKDCLIIGPYLIEINDNGEILKLREKIRSQGLKINFQTYL